MQEGEVLLKTEPEELDVYYSGSRLRCTRK